MRGLAGLALLAFLPACTLLIGDRRQDATDGGVDQGATDAGHADGGPAPPSCTLGTPITVDPAGDVGGGDLVALAAIGGSQFAVAYVTPGSGALVAAIVDPLEVVKVPTKVYSGSMVTNPRVARSDGNEPLHFSVLDGANYVLVTTDRQLGSNSSEMQPSPTGSLSTDVVQVPLNATAAAVCGGGSGGFVGFNNGSTNNNAPIVNASELRLSRDATAIARFAYLAGGDVYTGGFSVGTLMLVGGGKLFSASGLAGIGFDAFPGPPPRLLVAGAVGAPAHLVWAVGAPGMTGTPTMTSTMAVPTDGRSPISVAAWPGGYLVGYSAPMGGGTASGAVGEVQLVSPTGQPIGAPVAFGMGMIPPAPQLAFDFAGSVAGVAWRQVGPATGGTPLPANAYFAPLHCQ